MWQRLIEALYRRIRRRIYDGMSAELAFTDKIYSASETRKLNEKKKALVGKG